MTGLFKKNQNFILLAALLVIFCITATSCKNGVFSKKVKEITVAHTFPNTNWAFEEQVLTFDFDNPDTTANYQISFILNYDPQTITMEEIPVTVTLTAPNGMESFVTSTFRLKETDALTINESDGSRNQELVVFPKKDLRMSGRYSVSMYRKAVKADNYGFKKLSLRVKEVKE